MVYCGTMVHSDEVLFRSDICGVVNTGVSIFHVKYVFCIFCINGIVRTLQYELLYFPKRYLNIRL